MTESEKEVQRSQRQEQQADLLQEALSRPGIREVMLVFQGWDQLERNTASYHTSANKRSKFSASDHANAG